MAFIRERIALIKPVRSVLDVKLHIVDLRDFTVKRRKNLQLRVNYKGVNSLIITMVFIFQGMAT